MADEDDVTFETAEKIWEKLGGAEQAGMLEGLEQLPKAYENLRNHLFTPDDWAESRPELEAIAYAAKNEASAQQWLAQEHPRVIVDSVISVFAQHDRKESELENGEFLYMYPDKSGHMDVRIPSISRTLKNVDGLVINDVILTAKDLLELVDRKRMPQVQLQAPKVATNDPGLYDPHNEL